MALSINLKKKDKNTGKLIDDVRIFAAIIAVVLITLIVLIVFGVKTINEKNLAIDNAKTKYQQNQLAINNLKALQSKSKEYEQQRDKYDALIPKEQSQQDIMIEMEKRVENQGCMLTDIQFEEASTSSGPVKQINVTISILGDFVDIMKITNQFIGGEEFMRIDSMSIKNEADNKMMATMTVAKFYNG